MSRPEGEALSRLIAEVVDLRGRGAETPTAEELAERHGLGVETVRDALAGLAAIDDLVADPSVPGSQHDPLPKLPDDYEIRGVLGRGGAGVVYRARQKSLDREVAVKVLRPQDPVLGTALERFGREARVLARLRHPHIVSIHEVGETEGALYFTMDLVEGGTLAEHKGTRRRPIPIARAVKLMRQIGGAIGFVHGHGMVHRDLKPANVLIDEHGDAHVVDFGLAVDPSAGATLTATGLLLGTPAYMSPEQARGERRKIDERTDIYALGVILYELLTGVAPFARPSLVDTVQAVVHEDAPRPRELRPDLPVALERIVLKAMDKDPARRYATATSFVEDLARFEEGRPVEARSVTARTRIRTFFQQHADTEWLLYAALAFVFIIGFDRGNDPEEGLAEQLASIRQLEEGGYFEAADVLYLEAVDDPLLPVDLDPLEADVVFGALCARLAKIHAGEPDESIVELWADVGTFARMGGRPFQAELLRYAVALRWPSPKEPSDLVDERAALRRAMREQPLMSRPEDTSAGRDTGTVAPATAMDELRRILDRPDHPLRGPAGLCVNARWTADHWRFRQELTDVQRWRALPGWITHASTADAAWGAAIAELAFPDPVLGHELAEVSEPLLVLSSGDLGSDRRAVAFEALCHLHEIPSVVRSTPWGDSDDSRVGWVVGGIEDALEAPVEARPWLLGWSLLQADLEGGAEGGAETSIALWFRRYGFDVPDGRGRTSKESFAEWWERARRSTPEASLRSAIQEVPLEGELEVLAPEIALLLAREADARRARCLHELLAIAVGHDARAPQWPWGPRQDDAIPEGLSKRWLAFVGGDDDLEEVSVELLLVRWPGGNGTPEIVERIATDLSRGGSEETVRAFSALGTSEPRGLFDGPYDPPMEWELPAGAGRFTVLAERDWVDGRPAVSVEASVVSVPLGALGPAEEPAPWRHVARSTLELGRPVVMGAWLDDRTSGSAGARYAVLGHCDLASTGRSLGTDLDAWCDGVARNLDEALRAPSFVAVDEDGLAVGLECVSRLLATRPQPPVPSEALATLDATLGKAPPQVARFASVDVLAAAWALDLTLSPGRPSLYESIQRERTGWERLIVGLPEVFASSDDASTRAIGRASLAAEATSVTLPEARAIVDAHAAAGEPLEELPRQIVDRARVGGIERFVHPGLRIAALLSLLLAWTLPRGREWGRALVLAYAACAGVLWAVASLSGSRLDPAGVGVIVCHGLLLVGTARLERAHRIVPIASVLLGAALVVEQVSVRSTNPMQLRVAEFVIVMLASGVLAVIGDRLMGGFLEGAARICAFFVGFAMFTSAVAAQRAVPALSEGASRLTPDWVQIFGPMCFAVLALLFAGRIVLPEPDEPRPIVRRIDGARRRRQRGASPA